MIKLIEKVIQVLLQLIGIGWGSATVKSEVKQVKNLLNHATVLIDCGGNVGNYSSQLLSVFPKADIYTFEPCEKNYQMLLERFNNNKNVIIEKLGLSNTNSSSVLFSDKPGSGLASITKRRLDHFNISFDVQENIELMMLKDYWERNIPNAHIDLLKIDVEGSEMAVLEGLGARITDVKLIQFEFGGCNIDTKTYFQDFWYFFKSHDFKIFRISPLGLIEIKFYREMYESFTTTNYLCLNRKFN